MGEYLVISDDVRRAGRMARDLSADHPCHVHDLYEDALPSLRPRVIISDVESLTSVAFVKLQRCLEHLRSENAPFLFLVHGNIARAEAQAKLLKASDMLSAAAVAQHGLAKLRRLDEQVRPIAALAHKLGDEAQFYLQSVFFSGYPLTQSSAETGTDLITKAFHEVRIRDWVQTVQRFDDVTHQHILLVAGLATAFGTTLGLSGADQHRLTKAALLHDVGKTKIPPAILNKPGPLDASEASVMRSHAALGYDMLVGEGFDAQILAVVRSHHEMLDGSGYPDRLKGADIPDLVRLVTVCDIYAALIERRPYKKPISETRAREMLQSLGGRLDTDLVRAFHPVIETVGNLDVAAAA